MRRWARSVRKVLAGHWQLAVMTALVFTFWSAPAAFPLRMLIVFLHEAAHAAMAVLTGGRVVAMTLSPMEGGSATTVGGNFFLIASAGYLGSLLIGLGLLLVALRSGRDRWAVGLLGCVLLALSLWFLRGGFALTFGVATGAALLGVARFAGRILNDLLLRLIGLTSIVYVPYDIFSDTLARSGQQSDARIIAENFGGPTVLWGALWLLASLAAIVLAVRHGLGASSNIRWRP